LAIPIFSMPSKATLVMKGVAPLFKFLEIAEPEACVYSRWNRKADPASHGIEELDAMWITKFFFWTIIQRRRGCGYVEVNGVWEA
jgi:hypothetical protein